MRKFLPSCLTLWVLLALAARDGNAQPPERSTLPAPLVPVRPETRAELAHRQALKLYALGQMRLHEDRLIDATRLFEEAVPLDPEATSCRKALIPLYLALSRIDDALAACLKVLDLEPGDYETWALYAKQLKNKGQLKEARTALERAVACKELMERLDLRVQHIYELGMICEDMKAYDAAVTAFHQVTQILDHPQPLLDLGDFNATELRDQAAETYERMIKLCIAAKEYERALSLFAEGKPHHPALARRLNYNLAQMEFAQGQPAKALDYLDDYLKSQPRGAEAYELRNTILTQLHREEEILLTLEVYQARDQRNVALTLLLARQYAKAGNWEKGERLYLSLAQDMPTAEIYRGLFTLYHDRPGAAGMVNALTMLNNAIEQGQKKANGRDGDPQFAAKARAMLQALREDPQLARALLPAGQQAIQHGTGRRGEGLHAQTRFFLAVLARRAHQLPEAEQFYRTCLDDEGHQHQEHLIYAGLLDILWLEHKYDAIVEVCQRGLQHTQATNHLLFYKDLSRTLVTLGKIEEGLAAADKAVEVAPEDDRFWARRLRVGILMRAERFAQAVSESQAMLKVFTQSGQAHEIRLQLASVYSAMREFARAEEQIQLVLKEDPNDATANNNLGYQWADLGKNLEEAEKLIRKALDLDEQQRKTKAVLSVDDEGENAAYIDSLGWVLFRRGKLQEARMLLEKAVKLTSGEDDPTVWDHLGDVYARLEQPAKARAAWQKAMELYEIERRQAEEHYKELRHKLQLVAN